MSLPLRFFVALATIASFALPVSGAPNIVLVVVDGVANLSAPQRGWEEMIPDPEVRARLTPNLDRLAALGASFTCAQASTTSKDAGASVLRAVLAGIEGAPHQAAVTGPDGDRLEGAEVRPYRQEALPSHRIDTGSVGKDTKIRWKRLTPTAGRRKDDVSIEAWERLTDSLDDQLAAAWAAERIASHGADEPPQLLVVQLEGPASTWEAPGVFFDRFPLDAITPPAVSPDDRNDLPAAAEAIGRRVGPLSDDEWREALQAYFACVARADYALGKILDAVEPLNSDDDDTNDWALVFVSPRGHQLGQKGVWGPATPWEAATRVPLFAYAPGVTTPSQRIDTLTGVADVGPTIAALTGAEPQQAMAGINLLPLMAWKGGWPSAVAKTTVGEAATSLRSGRFRLIRYADGAEELYDHDHDLNESFNLLHPDNAAKIKSFGMSESQAAAVRDWLVERMRTASDPNPEKAIPGDFSRDGHVDAADPTIWRDALGQEVAVGTGADGDYDGRVEEDDRNVWLNNYGRTAGTSSP